VKSRVPCQLRSLPNRNNSVFSRGRKQAHARCASIASQILPRCWSVGNRSSSWDNGGGVSLTLWSDITDHHLNGRQKIMTLFTQQRARLRHRFPVALCQPTFSGTAPKDACSTCFTLCRDTVVSHDGFIYDEDHTFLALGQRRAGISATITARAKKPLKSFMQ